MKARLATIVALGWLALAPSSPGAQASEPDADEVALEAFLDSCSEAWQDVRTLRVHFRQTKELAVLRRARKSSGTVLVKDGRVAMVVNDEHGAVEMRLAVRDREARIHYPRLARLEIYALEEGRGAPTPFPLFGSDLRALERDYRMELERRDDGQAELRLTPRDERAAIRSVRMRFRDHRVRELEQVGSEGSRVRLAVLRYEPGVEIADEDLELEVPADTEIVRVLDPRRERSDE